MFVETLDPCRFNYLKKRIETDSEVLPLFDDTLLTKFKNVKMLAIYVQEPVVYTVTDCAKIIHLNKIKKMPKPNRDSKLSEIVDAFFEPNFFDFMISHFENMILCMSRIEQQKWKMSVLISQNDKQFTDEIIKRPVILVEKYEFAEQNGSEFFESFDPSQKIYIHDPETVKEYSHHQKGESIDKEDIKTSEKHAEAKKSFFSKVKHKFAKITKGEQEESKIPIEPGYILLGQKKDNMIILQRKKLIHPFELENSNDLKFLQKFLNSDIYFIEIDCVVKILFIKEEKPIIFIYSEVKEANHKLSKNIEAFAKSFIKAQKDDGKTEK